MADYEGDDQDPKDFLDRTESAARKGASGGGPEEDPWSSEETFDALRMERSVNPNETPEQMTKRILNEAGPAAAASIVHVALHSQNDNTRLAASRYITDWINQGEGAKALPWEDLVAEVIDQAELHANQFGG